MDKTISSILSDKISISELSTQELNSFIQQIVPEVNKLTDEEFELRLAQKKQVHVNVYLKQCETAIEVHKQKCESLRAAYISLSLKESHLGLKSVRDLYRRLRRQYQAESARESKPLKAIEEWEITPLFEEPKLDHPKLTDYKSQFSIDIQRTVFSARHHHKARVHRTKYRAEMHARRLKDVFLTKKKQHDETSHSVVTVLRSIDANLEAVNELFMDPPSHKYIWEDAYRHYVLTMRNKLMECEGRNGIVPCYNNREHTWSFRTNNTANHNGNVLELDRQNVVPVLRRMSGPDINSLPYGDQDKFTATTGQIYVPSGMSHLNKREIPIVRGSVSMGDLLGQYPLGFEAYQSEVNMQKGPRRLQHYTHKSSGSSSFAIPSPVKPLRIPSLQLNPNSVGGSTFPLSKSDETIQLSAENSTTNDPANMQGNSQFTTLALKLLAETASISSSNYDDLPLQSQGKPSSLGSIPSHSMSYNSSESIFNTEAYDFKVVNSKRAREFQPMNSIEKLFISTESSNQLNYTDNRKVSGSVNDGRYSQSHSVLHYPLQPLEDN